MLIKEKKIKFKEFLKSEYSLTSFYYIQLFGRSFKLCTELVVLDGVLIKFLDEGKIKHNYDEDNLLAVKHMIFLSALSKIMILIESFLCISDSLISDFKNIPEKMLKYRQKTIDKFIDKVKKGRLTIDDIWRIYGFPDTENLSLKDKEKAIVKEILTHSAEHIITFYKKIVKFYDNHRIPYNKFKHGLSIITGLKSLKEDYPLIAAIDRYRFEDIKKFKGSYISSKKMFFPDLEWFNLISLVPYGDETFKEYNDILSDLKRLVTSLVDNHFIRGVNLGTNYLPKNILTSKSFPERKFRKLKEIADTKIYPKMYIPHPIFKLELTIKGPLLKELKKHLEVNKIVTIWMEKI